MKVARLMWASGDQAHAYVLAQGARDGFLAAGDEWHEDYAEAVEWLELHPRP
jgi:hypothetical protein